MQNSKYIFSGILIIFLSLFVLSINQYNNNIQFSNENIILNYNEKEINLDEIMIHIILFILFDFDNINNELDNYFNVLKYDYNDDINNLREKFCNYVNIKIKQYENKNTIININNYFKLANYVKETDYTKKREISNWLINLFYRYIFVWQNGIKYDIEKIDNIDVKIISYFVFENLPQFQKIINTSNIYNKLRNYWEHFIVNFDLDKVVYDFIEFYSLPSQNIKIHFIYYGKNSSGFYKDKNIYLENCFDNKIITQSIFIHELAHFYDLYKQNLNEQSYEISIRSVFTSVFLQNELGYTNIENINVIKEFLSKYIGCPGFLIEFIADLSSINFINNLSYYEIMLKYYFIDLLKIPILTNESEFKLIFDKNLSFNKFIDALNNFNMNIFYFSSKSNMYMELINYFIKNINLELKLSLFQEDKVDRDSLINSKILIFINEKVTEILSNNTWTLKKRPEVLIYEYMKSKNK